MMTINQLKNKIAFFENRWAALELEMAPLQFNWTKDMVCDQGQTKCMQLTQSYVDLHEEMLRTKMTAEERRERADQLDGLIIEAEDEANHYLRLANDHKDFYYRKLNRKRSGPARAKYLLYVAEQIQLLATEPETEKEKWERIRRSMRIIKDSLGQIGVHKHVDYAAKCALRILNRVRVKQNETVKEVVLRELEERILLAKSGDSYFYYFLKRLHEELSGMEEVNDIPFTLLWRVMADYQPNDFPEPITINTKPTQKETAQ